MAELKDSGNRTEFASGAVRDIQKGKGRCDLLPLEQVSVWLEDRILYFISCFVKTKDVSHIYEALDQFVKKCQIPGGDLHEQRAHMALEVAKHFEDGAVKYGDRNWEKGIPIARFIDSGIRHYLKWKAGWTDEPHDRAFIWNMLCMLWTLDNYGWLEAEPEKMVVNSEATPYSDITPSVLAALDKLKADGISEKEITEGIEKLRYVYSLDITKVKKGEQ